MERRDAALALVFALLCVSTVVAPAVATPDGGAVGPGVAPLVQQGVQPDSTRLVVDVGADGSAHWEIQYWTRLDDQNTTDAFRALREDVRANPDNYTAAFSQRIGGTVAAAQNSTGREMSASNYSVTAETRSLPDSYGVVTYSFDWAGFAARDGDRLVVGDAIEGFYLDQSTTLIVSWPADYGTASVSPAPDDRRENTVIWRGSDTEFVSGEPRVVLAPGATGPGTTAANGDGSVADGGFPSTPALVAVVVLGALVVGGVFYLRSRGGLGAVGGAGGVSPDAGGESDEPMVGGPSADAEEAADVAASGGGDGASGAEGGDGEPAPPPELLSNEERVLRLIESRGGRIKQQEVAGALDWTDAKTSKVVRGMREEGTIEGFRLGRENVLRLPEDDESDDGSDEE